MNVAVRIPSMTREAFFAWAEAQDAPYEFDGYQSPPLLVTCHRTALLTAAPIIDFLIARTCEVIQDRQPVLARTDCFAFGSQ